MTTHITTTHSRVGYHGLYGPLFFIETIPHQLIFLPALLTAGAAFSLGPVSSRSGIGQFNPALISPRPPLPPGAPRRRDSSDELDEASSDFASRRQALPPTPPANRKHGRRLSTSALEMESSHDSFGIAGYGGRRRVRISGAGDDDLTSELSVEGSELSIASVASLVLYAPSGVRPPPWGGAINMDYLGTSRKRVSWAEYAEVRWCGLATWRFSGLA